MAQRAKIEIYNRLLLTRLARYLCDYADCITPEMIDETVKDCGFTAEQAFRTLATGVLDLYDESEVRELYLSNMFRLLDAAQYKSDPFMQSIRLETGMHGDWSVEQKRVKPFEAFVWNDLKRMDDGRLIPQIGFFDCEYACPRVCQGGREWMSVTPNEIETMKKPIARAFGDVVTYGLGLGYFAFMCQNKDTVKTVTVVERDASVIELFTRLILPQFPHKDKIRLIRADAFDYARNDARCDFVFADLWHDPSDGADAYLKLKGMERTGTEYAYWIEDTLRCYL